MEGLIIIKKKMRFQLHPTIYLLCANSYELGLATCEWDIQREIEQMPIVATRYDIFCSIFNSNTSEFPYTLSAYVQLKTTLLSIAFHCSTHFNRIEYKWKTYPEKEIIMLRFSFVIYIIELCVPAILLFVSGKCFLALLLCDWRVG